MLKYIQIMQAYTKNQNDLEQIPTHKKLLIYPQVHQVAGSRFVLDLFILYHDNNTIFQNSNLNVAIEFVIHFYYFRYL